MQPGRNVNWASITRPHQQPAVRWSPPENTRGEEFHLQMKFLTFCIYLEAGERCWAGLGWLWRTNLDWAGTHVSTKLTKSFHRSIPDRFLMSAAERSKKFALCSRWEAGTARLGWAGLGGSDNFRKWTSEDGNVNNLFSSLLIFYVTLLSAWHCGAFWGVRLCHFRFSTKTIKMSNQNVPNLRQNAIFCW